MEQARCGQHRPCGTHEHLACLRLPERGFGPEQALLNFLFFGLAKLCRILFFAASSRAFFLTKMLILINYLQSNTA
jgi:hypothetical protein